MRTAGVQACLSPVSRAPRPPQAQGAPAGAALCRGVPPCAPCSRLLPRASRRFYSISLCPLVLARRTSWAPEFWLPPPLLSSCLPPIPSPPSFPQPPVLPPHSSVLHPHLPLPSPPPSIRLYLPSLLPTPTRYPPITLMLPFALFPDSLTLAGFPLPPLSPLSHPPPLSPLSYPPPLFPLHATVFTKASARGGQR